MLSESFARECDSVSDKVGFCVAKATNHKDIFPSAATFCDPAGDRQTLSHNTGPGSFNIAEQELAGSKAGRKEEQSYEQAGTAASHQTPKGEMTKISAVGKVVVDTVSHQLCDLLQAIPADKSAALTPGQAGTPPTRRR